jgi:hypothetical protein
MNKTVQEIMTEVGYNSEWLALGIVDEPYLRTQYSEYQESEDKHQEHYRCRAFLDFLGRKLELTNGEITRIFALTDDGPDGVDLKKNRILELVISGVLTDEQMGALEGHPEIGQPPVQKQYQRACILRQLKREGLTDDSFRRVSESEDSELHKLVLERDDLRRSQVLWLAEHGGNKAVRNQARVLLESRRFRASPG